MTRRSLRPGHEVGSYRLDTDTPHAGAMTLAYGATADNGSPVVLREYFPENLAQRQKDALQPVATGNAARLFTAGLARLKTMQGASGQFGASALSDVAEIIEANGTAYLVERGEARGVLGRFIARRGALSLVNVRSLITTFLAGMAPWDERGLIHGAISTDTMVRSPEGQLRLGGLWHAALTSLAPADRLRIEGETPFTAPELVDQSNHKMSPASDIYGLGVLAWTMLTGHSAPTARERLAARDNGKPDPLSFGLPEGGTDEDRVFLQSLQSAIALNPADRPQTFLALRDLAKTGSPDAPKLAAIPALTALIPAGAKKLTETTAAPQTATPSLSPRTLALAGGGVTALVAIIAAALFLRPSSAAPTPPLPDAPTTKAAVAPALPAPLPENAPSGPELSPEDPALLSERRDWITLERTNPLAVRQYLSTATTPDMQAIARERLEELDDAAWQTAESGGTVADFRTYLDAFPSDATPPGSRSPDAGEAIARLLEDQEAMEQEARRQLVRLGYSLNPELADDPAGYARTIRDYQRMRSLPETGLMTADLLEDISLTLQRREAAEEAARLQAEREAAAEAARLEAERDAAAQAERARQEAERRAREAAALAAAQTPEPPAEPERRPGERFRDCPTCPELVVIPAGQYIRGGDPEAEGYSGREAPRRTVRIASALAVGRTEVTVAQYQAYLTATGRSQPAGCSAESRRDDETGIWQLRDSLSFSSPGYPQSDDHPAVCISWQDIQGYLRWVSAETGETYRLLTEAEWEYAARAGTTTPFFWGSDPNDACTYANIADRTASRRKPLWQVTRCRDGSTFPTETNRYQPNPFGLHDMVGNVWEWVEDCLSENYNSTPTDGSASRAGDCQFRVLRGGSWATSPPFLRSAYRSSDQIGARYDMVGFRVAREL